MGKVKENLIPDNYICDRYCESICLECQYKMETAHLYKKYLPRIETWYNKSQKKAQKIKDYFNKKKKVEIPF